MSPLRVYSLLRENIEAAANFSGARLSGTEVTPEIINSRELQMAVPVTTSREQWQQIERAIQYGKDHGVKVIVTPVSN